MHRFVWDLHYPPPGRSRTRISDFGDLSRHPALSIGRNCLAGRISGQINGEWDNLYAAADCQNGSTGENEPRGFTPTVRTGNENYGCYAARFSCITGSPKLARAIKDGKSFRRGCGARDESRRARGNGRLPIPETPEGRSLTRLNSGLAQLLTNVDSADAAPTTQQAAMFGELDTALREQLDHWQEIKNKDVPALNEQLKKAGAAEVKVSLADIETKIGEAEKAAGEDEP